MKHNDVWKIVDRPYEGMGRKIKTTDSRWVFKTKTSSDGNCIYKARLVIRGYKDTNEYELSEIYASFSRLPTTFRAALAIANKYNF